MDKTTLFPHEIALLALRKAEDVSRDFVLKAKRFAEEVIAGGGVTALGRRSERVRKKSAPVFAFFNQPSTILTFAILKDIEQASQQAEITPTSSTYSARVEEQSCLVNDFTETVGVNKEVYTALYNQVTDFEAALSLTEARTKEVNSPVFIGPLTQEFEAIRQGQIALPLTSEFKAYAALKKKGIEYIREDNAYIFPEEMVTACRHKFGDATRQQDANHFIVVRKTNIEPSIENQSRPHLLQNMADKFLNTIQQKGGSYAPAPAYA